jgi:hypothetical protein
VEIQTDGGIDTSGWLYDETGALLDSHDGGLGLGFLISGTCRRKAISSAWRARTARRERIRSAWMRLRRVGIGARRAGGGIPITSPLRPAGNANTPRITPNRRHSPSRSRRAGTQSLRAQIHSCCVLKHSCCVLHAQPPRCLTHPLRSSTQPVSLKRSSRSSNTRRLSYERRSWAPRHSGCAARLSGGDVLKSLA